MPLLRSTLTIVSPTPTWYSTPRFASLTRNGWSSTTCSAGGAVKYSECVVPAGHSFAASAGRHHVRRTAIIEMGSGRAITERCRDIETECRIAAVVMKADPSFGSEGRQIVMKRRPCDRTRAVMEAEINATTPQFGDHRDHW